MRPRPGPRHRLPALVTVVLVAVVATAAVPAGAAPAPGEGVTGYAPPVDAPVADAFRAPPGPYAAGNRGLDYATAPGTQVRAAAAGEVTFAGPVGGTHHVVILHGDGLRTSYSFLAAAHVRRGDTVGRGDVLGTSGSSLHLGVRAGERYVDPALLLDGAPTSVHLIPVEDRSPRSVGEERRGLLRALVDAGLVGVEALRWLRGEGAEAAAGAARFVGRAAEVVAQVPGRLGRAAGRVVATTTAVGQAVRAVVAARRTLAELVDDQHRCTPGDAPLPPPPAGRRIVVLVGGLGSSGGHADVLDLRTDALGYDPADRVQFSYAGGRVPGVGALDGVAVADYGPADTTVDLQVSGARLRRLLEEIAIAHPTTPVDVVAHSQGGLVAREALVSAGAAGLTVERVVTLGTPHRGAPAATIAHELDLHQADSSAAAAVRWLSGGDVDPAGASVGQMVEGSAYLERLDRLPLPTGVVLTSIAAHGDVVVPATASTLAGATNALVPLGDTSAHARLPTAPAATREIALALRGAGPTCVGTGALVVGVATATAVDGVERALGAAVAPAVAVTDELATTAGALAGRG